MVRISCFDCFIMMAGYVDDHQRLAATMAGIWGIVVYIGVEVLSHLLGGELKLM